MKDTLRNAQQYNDKKFKYLFISGSNFDKRDQVLLSQIINRDKDIRKLIRTATGVNIFPSLFLLIASFFFFFIPAFYTCTQTLSEIFSQSASLRMLCFILVPAVIETIVSFFRLCIQINIEVARIGDFCKILCKRLLPKAPLELWHQYPASMIDGQIALYVQRMLLKTNPETKNYCRLIYAGEPYASHVLLDSIDIEWRFSTTKGFLERHKISRHYHKYYRRYATNSIVSKAIDRLNKTFNCNSRRRQTSDCVFGLLFASSYFQSFMNKFNIKQVLVDLSQVGSDDISLAENALQYLTSPSHFVISDKPVGYEKYPIQMQIKHFNVRLIKAPENSLDKKQKRNLQQTFKWLYDFIFAMNPIHIPVKRLFLQPPKDDDSDPWLLNDLLQENVDTIVLLGGAEQSLPQCHLINRQRWSDDTAHQKRIGFAENQFDFDDTENFPYTVGTEGFIYGYRYHDPIAPDESLHKTKRNFAEVMQMKIDNRDVVILYGYHAISTKIAAGKYFLYNSPLVRNKANTEISHFTLTPQDWIKIYEFLSSDIEATDNPYEKFEKLKRYWDQHNPLDNPFLDPEEELGEIRTI